MNSKNPTLLVGIIVVALVAAIAVRKWPKPSDREQVERIVAELDAETPKNVDTITTLRRVSLHDQVVTTTYAISEQRNNGEAETTAMRQSALLVACSNKQSRKMLSMGYSLENIYIVLTTGGPDRIRILIAPSDCHLS